MIDTWMPSQKDEWPCSWEAFHVSVKLGLSGWEKRVRPDASVDVDVENGKRMEDRGKYEGGQAIFVRPTSRRRYWRSRCWATEAADGPWTKGRRNALDIGIPTRCHPERAKELTGPQAHLNGTECEANWLV